MGMELGWAQHLLQPWPVGWMAWRVPSAAAVLSSAAGAVWQPSRVRWQLGISSAQLSATDVGEPAGVQSSWLRSAGLSSGEAGRSELWESREPTGRVASRNSRISTGWSEWEPSRNRARKWESSGERESSGNRSWKSWKWKPTRRWSGRRPSVPAGTRWKTDAAASTHTATWPSYNSAPSDAAQPSQFAASSDEAEQAYATVSARREAVLGVAATVESRIERQAELSCACRRNL